MDTREKLIDLINRSACVKYGGEFGDEIIQEDIDISDEEIERIADHLIANGATVQKWIPVTERLPDDDIPSAAYLCWWHGHIQICKYWRTRKVFEFKGREVAAEYWMPLPEKPKEE